MATNRIFEPHCEKHKACNYDCDDCVAEVTAWEKRHTEARVDLLRLRAAAEIDWLES